MLEPRAERGAAGEDGARPVRERDLVMQQRARSRGARTEHRLQPHRGQLRHQQRVPRHEHRQASPLAEELVVRHRVPLLDEQNDALGVQVDARNHHDGIVREPLRHHREPSEVIQREGAVVVLAENVEDLLRDAQQRQVLDVRVVRRRVAHHVVHVVSRLPPADRNALQNVAHEDAQVIVALGADAAHRVVPHVMPEERYLLPEQAQQHARRRNSPGRRNGGVAIAQHQYDHRQQHAEALGHLPDVIDAARLEIARLLLRRDQLAPLLGDGRHGRLVRLDVADAEPLQPGA
mmetsp:Transcript_15792/g.49106  ORF Transcript_15792/g.49106 Transcript_15792/m.49106 type:complete len:291 (+) Transcript_15792:435-1307(+)